MGVTKRFLMGTIPNYETVCLQTQNHDAFNIVQNFLHGYFITVLQVIILLILFVKNFYFLIFFDPNFYFLIFFDPNSLA